jgi:hypothetical protein
MLGKLLHIESGRLAEDANALRREFDAQIAEPTAGAGEDASFDFFAKTGEIESGH